MGNSANTKKHHNDLDIGVAVIDCFTHYILQYLETLAKSSKATLQDFVSLSIHPSEFRSPKRVDQFGAYDPGRIHSHPGISTELSNVSPEDILVTDFFGGVASVEVLGKDGMLPVLGRKVGRWEGVRRPQAVDTFWEGQDLDVTAGNTSVRMTLVGPGWTQPLAEHVGVVGVLRGAFVLGALMLFACTWAGYGVKRKKD